ncbi:MAG TPA: DUF4279 domain-containing protein [Clostridia bacterium]|nr:DUF4279 domain-containing protein [Clostridia bacterium]
MWNDKSNAYKTYVGLRVYGMEMQPEEVTHALGFPPTRVSVYKGRTVWLHSTQKNVDNFLPLEKHVTFLTAKLNPRKEELAALQRRFATDISCFFSSHSTVGEFYLSADALRELADLHLSFFFDGYFSSSAKSVG